MEDIFSYHKKSFDTLNTFLTRNGRFSKKKIKFVTRPRHQWGPFKNNNSRKLTLTQNLEAMLMLQKTNKIAVPIPYERAKGYIRACPFMGIKQC